jgi:hypothetical protein
MAFRVVREPEDVTNRSPTIVEGCLFCNRPTRFWHEPTNNPVCEACAKVHRVAELPDYGLCYRRAQRKRRAEANTCSRSR